ncbi:MAG: carboxypeptidase-like regulatory domain-containing protein, partial [Dysgonamonadaceae bacterium]|nr:carboxypeptidase-like regulatory domain-containing protein [Dysgonamonadaceae bacterium]
MLNAQTQAGTVSGVVVSTDNEPLIGVTVKVNNTTSGTVTDVDGRFSIAAAPRSDLIFSYIGYKTKTLAVGTQTDLKVVLEEDVETLDEVVVVGYGVVKKSDLTGAVSSVKADELRNTATAGIESALQGKIPGVFINKKSGKPGETADIKIRGIGSFGGSGPLWIIDGVQQDPKAEFNMNDAESVEILRDGS